MTLIYGLAGALALYFIAVGVHRLLETNDRINADLDALDAADRFTTELDDEADRWRWYW